MSSECLSVVKTEADVIKGLAQQVEICSNDSIKQRNSFSIGLSGGSLCKFLCEGLPNIETSWENWVIYFCDERLVPESDKDSTLGLYINSLIGKVPLKREQFVSVDTYLEVRNAAKDYENKIRKNFGDVQWPIFDLLLLGMGPDGHTASLFPDHKLLNENKRWIAPIDDSPKLPPCRVTMTLPVINSARNCIFAMAGEGKAEMVKRIHKDKEELPATKVKPTNGKLLWILDEAAASQL